MRIAVIGCSELGLVTGGCLAAIGHVVICIDDDRERVSELAAGRAVTREPYLTDILATNRVEGRLAFTADLPAALVGTDAVFICLSSPVLEGGDADLSAVDSVARVVGTRTKGPKLVIEKSSLPVRTGEQLLRALEVYGRAAGTEFQVVSNPEFLREGYSVLDFLHPDRIVVGVDDPSAVEQMRIIYQPILDRNFFCPVHNGSCPRGPSPQFVVTSIISSELVKPASNSFLAMKISFANQLADLCEHLGADVEEVTRAMGMDPRIGPQFLRAGIGFGGTFFPKRIQAFNRLAESTGIHFTLLKETERINKNRLDQFMDKTKRALWVLKSKQVGILGLTFKPHTDDTRSAPALEILQRLIAKGASVRAYDPRGMPDVQARFPTLKCCRDAYETASGADALLLLTEWPEFQEIDWSHIRQLMSRPLVLDGRNLLNPVIMRELAFEYHCMGRPELSPRPLRG